MTDRLAQLMHLAVDDLAIPPPPSAEVIRHGRAARRRRRLTAVAGASALVLLAAGGAVLWRDGSDPSPERSHVTERSGSGLSGPVFSVGTTLYLDGGARKATIHDRAIKSLFYTSAGVLVRHGNNNYSDGGGPMRFSLVAPDGSVHPLDVTFEETVPSTDPGQPFMAYAEQVDGVVQVVVLDVRDGSEVARVPVPDAHDWGGWVAPPVSLDGDVVYVGTNDVARQVNWRTGEVSEAPQVERGFPEVRGGHAVEYDAHALKVVDVRDGATLMTAAKHEQLTLSPDGRYVLAQGGKAVRVVDLVTGDTVSPELTGNPIGWTPDDSVFALNEGVLTACTADTGRCATTTPDLAVVPGAGDGNDEDFDDDLRLGGVTYES